jgi:hypothetical protein
MSLPLPELVPLRSLGIETPLLLFHRNGLVSRWNLSSGVQQVVPGPEFIRISGVYLSPDGRWVTYYGKTKRDAVQYWLYDKKSGDNRQYREIKDDKQRGGIPCFSPDGRWIVVADNPDGTVSRPPGAIPVHLFDTDSLSDRSLGDPAGQSPAGINASLHAYWRINSRELFLLRISNAPEQRRYFSIEPGSSSFEEIEGRFDRSTRETEFLRDGIPVEHTSSWWQGTQASQIGEDVRSPEGSWAAIAKVNPQEIYELIALSTNGQLRNVHRGMDWRKAEPRPGAGVIMNQIEIKGWLDPHNFVYWEGGDTFVYNVKLDRAAELFMGAQHPGNYCW